MTDPRSQQIAVFVWGGVLLGMYSFLLSVFRIKNGGYPFWLPPFLSPLAKHFRTGPSRRFTDRKTLDIM